VDNVSKDNLDGFGQARPQAQAPEQLWPKAGWQTSRVQ
jgi:hypothetical protein